MVAGSWGVQLVLVQWLEGGCLGGRGGWNKWGSCCPCSGSTAGGEKEQWKVYLFIFFVSEFLMSHLVGC